jgi:drug/metabolite transporter (DMT)-like permease
MGVFASFLSAALSSAKDLISKRLASRLDGMTSTFASFAYALPYYVVLLTILYFWGDYLLGEETLTFSSTFLLLVLARSLTDTLAEGMKMHAFAHGDISVVACFFSISPLFLLITSPLITGDQTPFAGIVAVIVVVGGSVLVMYRPSATGLAAHKKGILLAIGASFFFSLNSCFDRLAVLEGTPVFAAFAMTLLSAAFLLPFIVLRRDRLDSLRTDHSALWTRGALEVGFMVGKLYAIRELQAPYVTGILRLSLVFSIIGGRVFFGETDTLRRLLAAALIIGGVVVISWLGLTS